MYSIKQPSTMIWVTLFSLIAATTFVSGSPGFFRPQNFNQDFASALGNNECQNLVTSQQSLGGYLHSNGFTVCKRNNIVTMKRFLTLSRQPTSPVMQSYPTWPLSMEGLPDVRQSPIDIITGITTYMKLPRLELINHVDEDVDCKVQNTGHTVQISLVDNSDEKAYIIGGPLNGMYIFEQVHTHWGIYDYCGSEHLINGESYSIEGHMVYFNSKYGDFDVAKDKPDGLCVVTYFAKIVNETNPLLEPLIELLPQISEPGQKIVVTAKEVLPWFSSVSCENPIYYTYAGSLTTSPFYQSVTFIIFPEPLTLSHKQLAAFRELHDDHGHYMEENTRRVQPLNGRTVIRADNSDNYNQC